MDGRSAGRASIVSPPKTWSRASRRERRAPERRGSVTWQASPLWSRASRPTGPSARRRLNERFRNFRAGDTLTGQRGARRRAAVRGENLGAAGAGGLGRAGRRSSKSSATQSPRHRVGDVRADDAAAPERRPRSAAAASSSKPTGGRTPRERQRPAHRDSDGFTGGGCRARRASMCRRCRSTRAHSRCASPIRAT